MTDYYLEHKENHEKAAKKAQPINKWRKKLLKHELELYEKGELINITHHGSTSVWLESLSSQPPDNFTNVYRPMGDKEIIYLIENNQLPNTQPYQAIIEGDVGRWYSEKYLNGKKRTDTNPSTVVEFTVPKDLIETLKSMQMKVEDGALSMGLGDKAGKGLPLFNKCISEGKTVWRIVKVKRQVA